MYRTGLVRQCVHAARLSGCCSWAAARLRATDREQNGHVCVRRWHRMCRNASLRQRAPFLWRSVRLAVQRAMRWTCTAEPQPTYTEWYSAKNLPHSRISYAPVWHMQIVLSVCACVCVRCLLSHRSPIYVIVERNGWKTVCEIHASAAVQCTRTHKPLLSVQRGQHTTNPHNLISMLLLLLLLRSV